MSTEEFILEVEAKIAERLISCAEHNRWEDYESLMNWRAVLECEKDRLQVERARVGMSEYADAPEEGIR